MENPTSLAYKVIHFVTSVSGFEAYALILGVLFICGMGVPIPEDITLISAGILAGQQQITFTGALIAGLVGVMIGDTILFCVGQKYGRKVFTWPVFNRIFTEARVASAEERITKHAKKICFTARFMPGLRAPIFLTAGIMKVPFRVFFLQDGLAALISVPIWIYLGYWFAENIGKALKIAKEVNFVIISVIVIGIVGYFIVHRKKRKASKIQ